MDKSCKLWGSLTNQQWEINFIINLVCALTNLIGIGPGSRPEAKKYTAELGQVMQWELLLSPAILDWLHVVLIPWHKAQGLSTSPVRLSASINEHNITNVNKIGFATLKSLTIIIKLSLKIFFLVPLKKKKVFVTHLLTVGNLILSKLQLEPASPHCSVPCCKKHSPFAALNPLHMLPNYLLWFLMPN